MKKILPLALAIVFSLQISAQELLGEWTLHYMIIDGVTIDVPQPEPSNIFYHPKIEFYESSQGYEAGTSISPDNNYFFESMPPMVIDTNTFTFQSGSVTLGNCIPYCQLEGDYLGTILGTGNRTFNYDITMATNGDRTLVITSPEGNIAVYGDFILGIQALKNKKVSLFPNPVYDKFTYSAETLTIDNLKIYTISGTKIFYSDLVDENQIDVSFLKAGLYFFQLNDETGNKYIQKFIKQ